MAQFVNSKKYPGIQYYIKSNGLKTYYIRYKDENNVLKRYKIGCESEGITENYCQKKRIEAMNALSKGEQPPKLLRRQNTPVYTLEYVANLYFSTKDNSTSTFERLSKFNKHLLPVLGAKDIVKISKDDLQYIQKSMVDKGLSNKTINIVIELFSTIFNFGFKEELYESVNPARKIQKAKTDNTRGRFLKKDEIDVLYDKCQQVDAKNNFGPVLELFVKLALTTGARLNGILNIKKRDVDLENELIEIVDFKNNSQVYSSYISQTIKGVLQNVLPHLKYDDHIISINFDGKKLTSRQIQCRLKPILDELFNGGINKNNRKDRIVIHSLRHTFASQLAMANIPIRVIQELLHHADISQTMKYAKVQNDSLKKALQSVF